MGERALDPPDLPNLKIGSMGALPYYFMGMGGSKTDACYTLLGENRGAVCMQSAGAESALSTCRVYSIRPTILYKNCL